MRKAKASARGPLSAPGTSNKKAPVAAVQVLIPLVMPISARLILARTSFIMAVCCPLGQVRIIIEVRGGLLLGDPSFPFPLDRDGAFFCPVVGATLCEPWPGLGRFASWSIDSPSATKFPLHLLRGGGRWCSRALFGARHKSRSSGYVWGRSSLWTPGFRRCRGGLLLLLSPLFLQDPGLTGWLLWGGGRGGELFLPFSPFPFPLPSGTRRSAFSL